MSPAERWLRERVGCAPPRLLKTMIAALPAEAPQVPDALGEAALTLYGSVLQGSGGREDALPLLAADALLPHLPQPPCPAPTLREIRDPPRVQLRLCGEGVGEAALTLYGSVLQGSGGREDALPLLAADALLTHAFAAQAELNPGGIADLAQRWGGAGRLGEVGEALTPASLVPRSAPPLPLAGEGDGG